MRSFLLAAWLAIFPTIVSASEILDARETFNKESGAIIWNIGSNILVSYQPACRVTTNPIGRELPLRNKLMSFIDLFSVLNRDTIQEAIVVCGNPRLVFSNATEAAEGLGLDFYIETRWLDVNGRKVARGLNTLDIDLPQIQKEDFVIIKGHDNYGSNSIFLNARINLLNTDVAEKMAHDE